MNTYQLWIHRANDTNPTLMSQNFERKAILAAAKDLSNEVFWHDFIGDASAKAGYECWTRGEKDHPEIQSFVEGNFPMGQSDSIEYLSRPSHPESIGHFHVFVKKAKVEGKLTVYQLYDTGDRYNEPGVVRQHACKDTLIWEARALAKKTFLHMEQFLWSGCPDYDSAPNVAKKFSGRCHAFWGNNLNSETARVLYIHETTIDVG